MNRTPESPAGPDGSAATVPTPPWWLGLGGLLPFAAGASFAFTADPLVATAARDALATYAAVILSFLGGVRWGALLRDRDALDRWLPLTLSVLPSLVAWLALALPHSSGLLLLLGGLIAQFLLDIAAARQERLPAWYARLRVVLTAGATAAVAAGWVATVVASS